MQYGFWTVVADRPLCAKARFSLCECACGLRKLVERHSLKYGQSRGCSSCSRLKYGNPSTYKVGMVAARSLHNNYQHSAKRRGIEFRLSFDEFVDVVTRPCVYCGQAERQEVRLHKAGRRSQEPFKYNGLDRLDNAVGYLPRNVQACCIRCNIAKHHFSEDEFFQQVKLIYEHNNLAAYVPQAPLATRAAVQGFGDGTSKSRKQSPVRSRRRQRPRPGKSPAGA